MPLASLTPLASLLGAAVARLAQAAPPAGEATRPEYSVLGPLALGVVALGLVVGLLRFVWRARRGGR